jgi:hypothetical protein
MSSILVHGGVKLILGIPPRIPKMSLVPNEPEWNALRPNLHIDSNHVTKNLPNTESLVSKTTNSRSKRRLNIKITL